MKISTQYSLIYYTTDNNICVYNEDGVIDDCIMVGTLEDPVIFRMVMKEFLEEKCM